MPRRLDRSASSNLIRGKPWWTRPAARVDAAERSMELYRLNYDFTKVVSPIDGQSSRYYKTLGNLVNQDQTLLTTVVSVDPMHVYFEMDEPTLLRYRKAVRRREAPSAQETTSRCRCSWDCKARTAFLTRGQSISSTTRAI